MNSLICDILQAPVLISVINWIDDCTGLYSEQRFHIISPA